MKLSEKILELELASNESRLKKLLNIQAPEVITEAVSKQIERLKSGCPLALDIKDKENLLDIEYTSHDVCTGSGGKKFIMFNKETDLCVNYFPNGRFGKFVAINSKK